MARTAEALYRKHHLLHAKKKHPSGFSKVLKDYLDSIWECATPPENRYFGAPEKTWNATPARRGPMTKLNPIGDD